MLSWREHQSKATIRAAHPQAGVCLLPCAAAAAEDACHADATIASGDCWIIERRAGQAFAARWPVSELSSIQPNWLRKYEGCVSVCAFVCVWGKKEVGEREG